MTGYKNKPPSHKKTGTNLKYISLSERSHSENVTYCVFNYMTFWKRKNYGDSKRVSCYKVEGEWGLDGAQRIFRKVKVLYDTIVMDTCHYILSKPKEYTTPRGNLIITMDFG